MRHFIKCTCCKREAWANGAIGDALAILRGRGWHIPAAKEKRDLCPRCQFEKRTQDAKDLEAIAGPQFTAEEELAIQGAKGSPGPGFRWILATERLEKGDQFKSYKGFWIETNAITALAGIPALYRRKI